MLNSLFPGVTSAQHLHGMAVHFPIVFWVTAAGAWFVASLIGREQRSNGVWTFGLWMHTLGVIGAVWALGFGWWAAEAHGHDSPGHDLVHHHRDFMIGASVLSLALTSLAWWKRDERGRWRIGLLTLSLVLVFVMALGSSRGAELVYRYGIGVANEPAPESDHDHSDHHH